MKNNVIIQDLNKLDFIKTSHKIGEKKILINNTQCASNLTQAAVGYLKKGKKIEYHWHPTMEEFYFFNKGLAILTINGENYSCKSGTFIKIPIDAKHCLKAIRDIQFVYWSIAI